MNTKTRPISISTTDNRRRSLRRRAMNFYRRFNSAEWNECYAMVDPELTRKQRPDRQIYVRELQDFKDVYGIITPWHTRISMYLEASPRQQDKRPFAYVYTVWQDENHGFHMFRERWVFHNGRWYTRVAGLIANRTTTE